MKAPREPLSVLTNVAYLIAGVLAARSGNPLAFYVGCCFVFLSIASTYYHWTFTERSELVDEIGIYLLLGGLTAVAYSTHAPLMVLFWLGSLILAYWADIIDARLAAPLQAGIVLAAVGIGYSWSWAGILLLGLLISILLKEMGNSIPQLRPYRDYLHAGWHLYTAFFFILPTL